MRTLQIAVITAIAASLATLLVVHLVTGQPPAAHDPHPGPQPRSVEHPPVADTSGLMAFASSPPAQAGTARDRAPAEGDLDTDESGAHTREIMDELDRRFRSEPVSAVWARNTELIVVDSLVSDEAKAAGVALPEDFDIHCRTSLCRIKATYADDGAAVDALTILAMDVSQQLPRMHRQTIYKADGSTEVIVYAMK